MQSAALIRDLLAHGAYRASSSSQPDYVNNFSSLMAGATDVFEKDIANMTPDYYAVKVSAKFRPYVEGIRDPYLGKFKSILAMFTGTHKVVFKEDLLHRLDHRNEYGQTLAYVAARFYPTIAFDLLYQCAKLGHKLDDFRNGNGDTPQHGYAWGLGKRENKIGYYASESFSEVFGLYAVFWRFGCDIGAKNANGETVEFFYDRVKLQVQKTENGPFDSHTGMRAISRCLSPVSLTYIVGQEVLGELRSRHDLGPLSKVVAHDAGFRTRDLATDIGETINGKETSWNEWVDGYLKPKLLGSVDACITEERQKFDEIMRQKKALFQEALGSTS